MFGHHFYGARFYGPRYFGPGGAVVVIPPEQGATGGIVRRGGKKRRTPNLLQPLEHFPPAPRPVVIELPATVGAEAAAAAAGMVEARALEIAEAARLEQLAADAVDMNMRLLLLLAANPKVN